MFEDAAAYVSPYLRWIILRLYGDFYVKTGGDDQYAGTNWTTAWATVHAAMTQVLDGKTIHIGYGNYLSEPTGNSVMPENVGDSGIKIYPEKDDGTGQVSGSFAKILVH